MPASNGMILREHVSLRTLTTFKTGGPARALFECGTVADVVEALAYARDHALPWYVLGEGSNVLATDAGYEGVVLRIRIPGITMLEQAGVVYVTAGGGESWDGLVRAVAARGLWGIESLAGIPGTVGAAPVQNIGAYGAELADTFEYLEAIEVASGKPVRLSREECGFGYRESRFKHTQEFVITSVTLVLSLTPLATPAYPDLVRAKEAGEDLSTPAAYGDAVRRIRARKFPDLAKVGTAGSFFKNPVMTSDAYDALVARIGETPRFPAGNGIHPVRDSRNGSMVDGGTSAGTSDSAPVDQTVRKISNRVKVPLAHILDKVLGLRGFRKGNAFLYDAQPLVLVLDPGGTAHEVDALARDVEEKVFDATGIRIEREVRTLA